MPDTSLVPARRLNTLASLVLLTTGQIIRLLPAAIDGGGPLEERHATGTQVAMSIASIAQTAVTQIRWPLLRPSWPMVALQAVSLSIDLVGRRATPEQLRILRIIQMGLALPKMLLGRQQMRAFRAERRQHRRAQPETRVKK